MTVARYRDPIDAQVRRTMLEAAGIPAFVADDHLIGMDWLYSAAVGGARLQVQAEDEAAAREWLGADATAELAAVEESREPDVDGDLCPRCGSDRVRESRLLRTTLALSLVSGVPLFAWRNRWVCERCGHVWRMASRPAVTVSDRTREAEEAVRGPRESYALLALFLAALFTVFAIFAILGRPDPSG